MRSAAAHSLLDSSAAMPPQSAGLRLPSWAVWTLSLAIVLTYFSMLGGFGLAEPDEPRYAEIAREMLERRDWVTPHLNYVKYFEKPPLIYWLTALNFRLFGMGEWVVRLWPAVFGVVGIAVAYALGRAMYGRWTGAVAAALLAATPFYFGLSQILILDMPLSGLMAVALGAFWFAYTEERWRRGCVCLFYAATALAVLTKGPVAAVLAGGIIGAFLVLQGNLRALGWVLSPIGLGLFLAIALPWFVLVSQRNPEFVDFFVVRQHFDRFVRPNEHQEPLWFFVPIVFGGMLPWTAAVLFAPRLTGRFLVRLAAGRVSPATRYCVLWSATVFLFFSVSGSKLATYVLPMLCPLAILAARFFAHVIGSARADVLRRAAVFMLVLAAATLLAAVFAGEVVDDWRAGPILARAYGGAVVLAAIGGAMLVLLRRAASAAVAVASAFATLVLGVLAVQLVAISGRGVAAAYRPLGLIIRVQASPDDQVIIYRHYVQGITFYARRRAVMVGGRGELDFGSRQGDQRAFFWDSDAQLADAWRSGRRLFLVINRAELDALLPQLTPAPRPIAGHGKKVVVVNFD